MTDNLKNFIEEEKEKLQDIQVNLRPTERTELLPKINEIRILLNILAKGNISKKEIKDIKNKIDKETDKLEDETEDTEAEKDRKASNFVLTSQVKPNTKFEDIPQEIINEAHLAKASGIYHDNQQNNGFEFAQKYINDNKIPFDIDRELSNQDILVLHNKDTNEVKIAGRGTKFNNMEDLITDGQILIGNEKNDPQFIRADEQIKAIKKKYGKVPDKGVGFSKGYALISEMGDRFGFDTTGFNGFIGRTQLNKTQTSANHTLYRTTEDIPSVGAGFKKNAENWEINTIYPLKDSLNPKEAHGLENFIDRGERATKSTQEEMLKKIQKTAGKHGEAEIVADMLSHIEGTDPIPISKDIYNMRAKVGDNTKSHLVGTRTDIADFYEIGEQVNRTKQNPDDFTARQKTATSPEFEALGGQQVDLLVPEPQAPTKRFKALDNKPMEASKKLQKKIYDRFLENGRIDNEEYNYLNKRYIEGDFETTNQNPKRFEYETRQAIRGYENSLKQLERKFGEGKISFSEYSNKKKNFETKIFEEDLVGVGNRQLKEQTAKARGEAFKKTMAELDKLPLPSKFDPTTHPLGKPMYPPDMNELRIGALQGDLPTSQGASFAEYIHKFNGERGVDTKIENGTIKLDGKRIGGNSRHAEIWNNLTDGDFQDHELEHLNNTKSADREAHLTQEEITTLKNMTPEERYNKVKSYEQEAHNAIEAFDDHTSIENLAGTESRGIGSSIMRGLHPMNLATGVLGGVVGNEFVDFIDPHSKILKGEKREVAKGVAGGMAGEAGVLALAGETIGAGALGTAGLAGGVGVVAGDKMYEALKKSGASDFEATTGAGLAGGAGAGATTGLLGTIGTFATYGAEAGLAEAPETLGLSVLVGAGLGTIVGAGSYGLAKGYNAIKSLF
jgi:hypothetical protein